MIYSNDKFERIKQDEDLKGETLNAKIDNLTSQ